MKQQKLRYFSPKYGSSSKNSGSYISQNVINHILLFFIGGYFHILAPSKAAEEDIIQLLLQLLNRSPHDKYTDHLQNCWSAPLMSSSTNTIWTGTPAKFPLWSFDRPAVDSPVFPGTKLLLSGSSCASGLRRLGWRPKPPPDRTKSWTWGSTRQQVLFFSRQKNKNLKSWTELHKYPHSIHCYKYTQWGKLLSAVTLLRYPEITVYFEMVGVCWVMSEIEHRTWLFVLNVSSK